MKRMMMAALLLVSTVSVFAADQKSERKGKKDDITVMVKHEVTGKDACTISLEATIGPDFAKVKVNCSYTASNCREAAAGAKTCLDEARKAIQ